MEDKISSAIKKHLAAASALAADTASIRAIADALAKTALAGGKILICGNGGSAADSQHIAGELVGRFKKERRAIAAIALTTDTSILTCLGNDYGFDRVFERQVEALGRKNAAALQRVFRVAQRLSGLAEDEVDELTAALGEDPSVGSGSD